MSELLRLAGVRRRSLILAILAGSVTLLSALALTVLSGWLITRAWQMPPILDLGVAITAVRALGISRAVFRYLDRLYSHQVALDATTRLRPALFDAIISDPHGTVHTLSRGAALTRLGSDVDRLTDYIVRSLIPAGIAVVLSVCATLFATWLSPWAGLVLLGGLLVTGLVVPYLVARSHQAATAVTAADEFVIAVDDQLLHRAEFAVAGLSDARLSATLEASGRSSLALAHSERPLAVAAFWERLSTGFAVACTLAVGLLCYTDNPTWLGMLILLPLAAFESHGPLASAAIHAVDARAAATRLAEFQSHPTDPGECPGNLDISARGVQLAHGERTWGLSAPFGTRHHITGPSGIGKTTFLLTLAGLIPAASGELTIGGLPIGSISPAWLRQHVRAHPENEWIFATTIRDNILVANPTASDGMMREMLGFVGLQEFQLDDVLESGADSLSSGQRRRLLLARALCSEAAVLLLDEPTEHISHDDAEKFLHTLLQEPLPGARANRTVIVVTHTREWNS